MARPCLSPFPEAAAVGRVAPAAHRATPVVEDRGLALSHLQGALRFAAHDDHKIGILASLDARGLVRDDEGRAWQHNVGDALDRLLWDGNAVEGGFGPCDVSRSCLASPPLGRGAARADRFGSNLAVAVAVHRDDAPPHALTGVAEGSEDVGA